MNYGYFVGIKKQNGKYYSASMRIAKGEDIIAIQQREGLRSVYWYSSKKEADARADFDNKTFRENGRNLYKGV